MGKDRLRNDFTNKDLTPTQKAERLRSVRNDAIPGPTLRIKQEARESRNTFAQVVRIDFPAGVSFQQTTRRGRVLAPRTNLFIRMGSSERRSKNAIIREALKIAGPAIQKYGLDRKDLRISISSLFDRSED